MFAVIKTGGKQYRVTQGDIIVVEKLTADEGSAVTFDSVLMLGEDGKAPTVGTPVITNATVTGEVVEQGRGEKITVFKKKRRQGYRRTKGHRQLQTVLKITEINGKGGKAAAKPAAKKTEKPAEEKAPAEAKEEAAEAKAKPAAKKAPAKKPAAKKPATAKSTTTKKPATAKSTTTKKPPAKKPAAKKPAAKAAASKSTTKSAGAKKPAAKKAPAKKDD